MGEAVVKKFSDNIFDNARRKQRKNEVKEVKLRKKKKFRKNLFPSIFI